MLRPLCSVGDEPSRRWNGRGAICGRAGLRRARGQDGFNGSSSGEFWEETRGFSLFRLISFAGGIVVCGMVPAIGDPQHGSAEQVPNAGQQPQSDEDQSYNGLDFTRPQTSLQTRIQFRETSKPTSRTDQGSGILQYNSKIDLSNQWKLSFQAQLPYIDKKTTMFGRATSDTSAGIGDILGQAVLIQTIDKHWAYGFGVRLLAPTADEAAGGGRWQIMPGFGFRYSFVELGPDTYFVPAVRYAISFAGDPTRRNINEPQFAPTFNLGLPDRWFVTLYPSYDIRINFGDLVSGQTGRLFLPFDFAVGRTITDSLTTSLEVSFPIVKDYPVYDFKTELRVTWRF